MTSLPSQNCLALLCDKKICYFISNITEQILRPLNAIIIVRLLIFLFLLLIMLFLGIILLLFQLLVYVLLSFILKCLWSLFWFILLVCLITLCFFYYLFFSSCPFFYLDLIQIWVFDCHSYLHHWIIPVDVLETINF